MLIKYLKKWNFFLLTISLIFFLGNSEGGSPQNYFQAKRAAKKIFQSDRRTFYCNCPYDELGKIQTANCGYVSVQHNKKSKYIEFEHLMPASDFGKSRLCWQKKLCLKKVGKMYKGRLCCQKIDKLFSLMEADLHNIVPEIGELNRLRSNFHFRILPDIPSSQFGNCYFKIDIKNHAIEPSVRVRGIISRAYLYMSYTYDIPLSVQDKILFKKWHALYPPTLWELKWNEEVFKIQGNYNPYVIYYLDTITTEQG